MSGIWYNLMVFGLTVVQNAMAFVQCQISLLFLLVQLRDETLCMNNLF
jgi:hypothetical protein